MIGFLGKVSFNDIHLIANNNTITMDFFSFGVNSRIEYKSNNKFNNDKLFVLEKSYFISIDGVIHNSNKLLYEFSAENISSLILSMWTRYGVGMLSYLKGDFSIFIIDINNENVWLITNPVNSKPIFYHKTDSDLYFASNALDLAAIMTENGINYTLSEIGAYYLLTYGYMLNDVTLIEEIKKLSPGSSLKIDEGKLQINNYKNFDHIITNKSESYFIEELHNRFLNSLDLEMKKDTENSLSHIITLSGGLDSRIVVMLAHKLGYDNLLNITFSQSNYLDEKISKQISKDLKDSFMFQSLDNGSYLTNISEPVDYNGGLVLYCGSAHLVSMLKNLNFSNFGLLHTGMLGDAVLGTYLTCNKHISSSSKLGLYSSKLFNVIAEESNKVHKLYSNDEQFLFYNRGINGIFNGYHAISQYTEFSSPFMETDFLDTCFSIPAHLKYNRELYFKWIIKKIPEANNYIWEATGCKLTASKPNKLYARVIRKLSGNSSMNPFEKWLINNSSLESAFQSTFIRGIETISKYPNLYKDCNLLYKNGTFLEKAQVITLLTSVEKYFNESNS